MRVYERMYTTLLNGVLESLNVLSPVKTKQALQALCLLKTVIKEAEEIFISEESIPTKHKTGAANRDTNAYTNIDTTRCAKGGAYIYK